MKNISQLIYSMLCILVCMCLPLPVSACQGNPMKKDHITMMNNAGTYAHNPTASTMKKPDFHEEELSQPMSKERLKQILEMIKDRGSAYDDYYRLKNAIKIMANHLVTLAPGSYWAFPDGENAHSSCCGTNILVDGEHRIDFTIGYWTSTIVMTTNWRNGQWHKAFEYVRKYVADNFGATLVTNEQSAKAPDIYFENPTNGTCFKFGFENFTILSAGTGMRIRQDIYDGTTSIDEAVNNPRFVDYRRPA